MLAHRLRRWPNIKTALIQRLVFTGLVHHPQSYAGPTLKKQRIVFAGSANKLMQIQASAK